MTKRLAETTRAQNYRYCQVPTTLTQDESGIIAADLTVDYCVNQGTTTMTVGLCIVDDSIEEIKWFREDMKCSTDRKQTTMIPDQTR
ncbi:hypothetical protein DPMN_112386 [Dreissena polymorpha]|uniref:Uncharacterized protein n=1 Tax=Dreissena polymorpha TaxID=45954 RepID=A0A9D4KG95_DREPO|nr:hypothetical protein DPMN_112386 [Dreissena polymorpha]